MARPSLYLKELREDYFMFERAFKLHVIGMMSLAVAACNGTNFTPGGDPSSQFVDEPISMPGFDLTELSAKTLGFNNAPMTSHNQINNTRNQTIINFQAIGANGEFINTLNPSEVILTENGVEIPNFQLSNNARQVKPTTDIVFLVDITCSMSPTINSAKSAVINFIRNSRANGYHTRMCLSTFGDYTVQKCNKFYDNDPSKASTMTQVNELISEVTRLSAGCGSQDPGGQDLPENPLRAIIDAEAAPYAPGSQRFGILLTDADFLYAPGNPGSLGAAAPVYADALASLARSQLNLFVAAPSTPGYDRSFGAMPGIVPASNGEFFPYQDLISGKTNFAAILNRITLRIQTTYTIQYVVDEIPGLDATLPLSSRNIQVRYRNTSTGSTIRMIGVESTMPNGQQALLKKFKISDRPILPGAVVVKVNGVQVMTGYTISGNELTFNVAPVTGAKIDIYYLYQKLKDAVSVEPVTIDGHEDMNNISIFLNGVKATSADLKFERNLDGNWTVTLNDGVFSEDDRFQIRAKGLLRVRVFRSIPL